MNRRDAMTGGIGGLALLALSGCALEADVANTLAKHGVTAAEASLFFGFVKGCAECAVLVDPVLSVPVGALLLLLQQPMAAIEADIATAEDLASALATSAKLVVLVAPAVKVFGLNKRTGALLAPM